MALSEREIAYIISAKDEASQMFQKVNQAAEKSGQSIKQAMDESSRAVDRASGSTSKLTQFIREQRTENRMQNFLFREGAGAIATFATGLTMLSSTAGAAGESTKQLSNALNAGFVAFQSFDFLLAGIGVTGGLGLAIAGLAAAAAAIMAFTRATEDSTAKLDAMNLSIKEQEYRLQMLSAAEMMQAYTKALADAYREQERLNQKTVDWWATIKNTMLTMTPFAQGTVVRKVLGSPEELAGAQKAINDIFLSIQSFQEKEEKKKTTGETVLGSPDKIKADWDEVFKNIDIGYSKIVAKWDKSMKTIGGRVKEVHFEFNKSLLEIGIGWNTLFDTMQVGIWTVASDVAQGWSAAFDRAFGIGHTLLGRFFNAITTYIAQLAAQLAASAAVAGLLSIFGLGFGSVFGALVGPLAGLFGLSAGRPGVAQQTGIESSSNRGGPSQVVVINNFNSPVPHGEWIKSSVEEGLRRTGLAASQYFQNTRTRIDLVTA